MIIVNARGSASTKNDLIKPSYWTNTYLDNNPKLNNYEFMRELSYGRNVALI